MLLVQTTEVQSLLVPSSSEVHSTVVPKCLHQQHLELPAHQPILMCWMQDNFDSIPGSTGSEFLSMRIGCTNKATQEEETSRNAPRMGSWIFLNCQIFFE